MIPYQLSGPSSSHYDPQCVASNGPITNDNYFRWIPNMLTNVNKQTSWHDVLRNFPNRNELQVRKNFANTQGGRRFGILA